MNGMKKGFKNINLPKKYFKSMKTSQMLIHLILEKKFCK